MFRVISKEIILSWSLKNPFMGEREREREIVRVRVKLTGLPCHVLKQY